MLDPLPQYPVNEFGPLMKGMVIGGLGIFHVFLAQFAIGGGMLLCYFEWLAQKGKEPNARRFSDGFFKVLVLVSFVAGALTGVGMWFTSIQVSPVTIGLMIDEFHWIWAIEWLFFSLEICAGYTFYRFGPRLPDKVRMRLLVAYSVAAWASLFWINGILSWQLTPGAWLDSGSVWAGFFNPSFFPSLLFRTVVAMTLAGLAACVVINTMPGLEREEKQPLIARAARFLAPMALLPVFGVWYLGVIPEDSLGWLQGGSIAMSMFLGLAVGATVLIAGYGIIGLRLKGLYINGATATVLVVLAFVATAAGEFVREGVRKPYTVRQVLYSNALTPDQVEHMREHGSVQSDRYPLRDADRYVNDQLRVGAKVYRRQCSVCHTMSGTNGVVHLAGSWSEEQMRMNLAALQHTKAFMPPFAGNAEEVEALVQLLLWVLHGEPDKWAISRDPAVLERIAAWLREAGTEPGTAYRYRQRRGQGGAAGGGGSR